MARLNLKGNDIVASKFMIFFLLSSFATTIHGDLEHDIQYQLDRSKEKLSHFHFYFHDTVTGKNPSAVVVVPPPSNKSATQFGSICVIDDPLTEGPELSSKLVGRAQGLCSSASQEEFSLLMAMNIVFLDEKYNGSTITILGRNTILAKVREMPVIGGSGMFRFARGFARATTYSMNQTSFNAVVEYNVYVLHY